MSFKERALARCSSMERSPTIIFRRGYAPNPTRTLRGAPTPHAAPAGRALSRGRSPDPSSDGATPRTPRGRFAGPQRPTPRPRAAHYRAAGLPIHLQTGLRPEPHADASRGPAPRRARGPRIIARPVSRSIFRRGYAPNPTRNAPRRARGPRIIARPVSRSIFRRGYAPNPTRTPHAAPAGRALSRGRSPDPSSDGATPRTPRGAPRRARGPRIIARVSRSIFRRGYAPNPTRTLRGAPTPHAAPAGRALSRGRSPDRSSDGATPRTPRGRFVGPQCPTPRPRAAHYRAPWQATARTPRGRFAGAPMPHAAPAGRALPRALVGYGPNPTRTLRGAPMPHAAPAGRALPRALAGFAPNPTRWLVGPPEPHAATRAAHYRAAKHATDPSNAASRDAPPGEWRDGLLTRGHYTVAAIFSSVNTSMTSPTLMSAYRSKAIPHSRPGVTSLASSLNRRSDPMRPS